MKLTTVVKLHTSQEEHASLLETLRTCNATCDRISLLAFDQKTFRKFDLHHLTYHNVRAETELAAGHVVCAVAKVANAYKLDKGTLRTFDPTGGIEFNKDTLAWKVQEQTVSVNTVCGRLKLRFLCSAGQKQLLHGKRGQADLLLRKGQFYLSVAVTVEEASPFEPQGVIGIDLGIVQIATEILCAEAQDLECREAASFCEGHQYSGEPVQKVRKKCRKLRKLLQPKKTRSARKHLQKASKRESRFVKDVNHCISKNLVQLAIDRQKALACEDLTGIRGRGNSLNRAMRTELNHWAFHQLKLFLVYKCQRAGVTLIEVDPRYSSQTCSGCGHCERGNRKSQESFECLKCGLKLNADVNAALNLKARGELSAALMFRLDALCFQLGTSRLL